MAKAIIMKKGEQMVKTGVGFAWFGLFFNFLWLASKGLWRHAGIILLAAIGLSVLFRQSPEGPFAGWLILGLITGTQGNKWHRNKLTAEGYKLAGE